MMTNKKKRKKAAGDNASLFSILRRVTFGWVGLTFSISALMFFLGVLVGRGTAPVHFDMDALEKDLAALKEKWFEENPATLSEEFVEIVEKPDLEFYDALKKTPSVSTPADASRQNEKPEHKTRKATKDRTKKVVISDGRIPPAKPVLPPEASDTGGAFTIQIAAFKESRDAARMVSDLTAQGYPAYRITVKPGDGTTWYRVRVGSFRNKADAADMLGKLQKQQKGAYLVLR